MIGMSRDKLIAIFFAALMFTSMIAMAAVSF
ncbi:surface glycoprotein [Salinarchaeum sp. IM2453]|nr:surface glycoprotein [Salinarchaeum sp. IM2453]QZA89475.1 surface glycoprotein [Salinarchaeum sp. IM2453]